MTESSAKTTYREPLYCPFCGNDYPEVAEEYSGAWGVFCDFCNASVTGYKTREAAVKQWNHRYRPDEERR